MAHRPWSIQKFAPYYCALQPFGISFPDRSLYSNASGLWGWAVSWVLTLCPCLLPGRALLAFLCPFPGLCLSPWPRPSLQAVVETGTCSGQWWGAALVWSLQLELGTFTFPQHLPCFVLFTQSFCATLFPRKRFHFLDLFSLRHFKELMLFYVYLDARWKSVHKSVSQPALWVSLRLFTPCCWGGPGAGGLTAPRAACSSSSPWPAPRPALPWGCSENNGASAPPLLPVQCGERGEVKVAGCTACFWAKQMVKVKWQLCDCLFWSNWR